MPEETNSASSPPAESEAKEPKTRKAASKGRPKAEEKKLQEVAKEPKPEVTSDRVTNDEHPGKSTEDGKLQEVKRPNRRRRGKGKAQAKDTQREPTDTDPVAEKDEPKEKPANQGSAPNAQRPPHKPRRNIDADKLAKNAWKIYLAEVSEEGVALIGDNDARELARRCFRLAEIFLEEEDRRS